MDGTNRATRKNWTYGMDGSFCYRSYGSGCDGSSRDYWSYRLDGSFCYGTYGSGCDGSYGC